jgi:hypothetical protein
LFFKCLCQSVVCFLPIARHHHVTSLSRSSDRSFFVSFILYVQQKCDDKLWLLHSQLLTNRHRTGWPTYRFVSRRYLLRISEVSSAVWTEVFCRFPHCVQEVDGLLPWLGHDQFLAKPFRFFCHNTLYFYYLFIYLSIFLQFPSRCVS